MPQPKFLKKPITEMTHDEWESLCDGCGLCCQHKEEDEDGEIFISDVACNLLCLETHRCTNYEKRQEIVPECIKATPENIMDMHWLPTSCGYRRAAFGQPLPKWHHLVCGDKNRVHTHGPSMMGMLISAKDAGWDDEDDAAEGEEE